MAMFTQRRPLLAKPSAFVYHKTMSKMATGMNSENNSNEVDAPSKCLGPDAWVHTLAAAVLVEPVLEVWLVALFLASQVGPGKGPAVGLGLVQLVALFLASQVGQGQGLAEQGRPHLNLEGQIHCLNCQNCRTLTPHLKCPYQKSLYHSHRLTRQKHLVAHLQGPTYLMRPL